MSVTILYWARSHGERGGGGGDSSDNIQIDSYHMAATGTASSSSSSNRRKASGDDQQRRATSAATAGNSVLNQINEQPRVWGGIMISSAGCCSSAVMTHAQGRFCRTGNML